LPSLAHRLGLISTSSSSRIAFNTSYYILE
jgi:hypothetical protein